MDENIKLVLDVYGIDWDYSWVTERQSVHQLKELCTYKNEYLKKIDQVW
jgi:hypothetical protein